MRNSNNNNNNNNNKEQEEYDIPIVTAVAVDDKDDRNVGGQAVVVPLASLTPLAVPGL